MNYYIESKSGKLKSGLTGTNQKIWTVAIGTPENPMGQQHESLQN